MSFAEFVSFVYPIAVIALTVFCLIHVFKTGREWWWALIILFFHLIGPLIYLIVEVLPDLRAGRGLFSGSGLRASPPASPQSNLKQLEKQVEEAPTVDNRRRLAEAHFDLEHYRKAAEIYRDCLSGPYEDDPTMRWMLAQAEFEIGNHEATLELLDKLDEQGYRDYKNERALLRAKALAAQGERDLAIRTLRPVVSILSGQEARYYLGKWLLQEGEAEEGRKLLEEVKASGGNYSGVMRKRQQKWIDKAREALETA
jgi:hypothetical protein